MKSKALGPIEGKVLPKLFAAVAVFFLIFPAFSFAEPIDSLQPSGFVNDFAGVLSPEQKAALEEKLVAYEANSSNEIAVAIVKNLDGDYIEHYAVKLFEKWGIGKQKQDNGVLVLVAVDDRKVRIEVGYGLEGKITDGRAKRIIEQDMLPNFRNSDYYGGVDAAVDKIIYFAGGGEDTVGSTYAVPSWVDVYFSIAYPILFLAGFASLVILMRTTARNKGKRSTTGAILAVIVALCFSLLLVPFVMFFIDFTWWVLGLLAIFFELPLLIGAWKWGGAGIPKGGRSGGYWGGGLGGFGGSGGGFSGGGGFGGFGGGMSGGGGSSGGW